MSPREPTYRAVQDLRHAAAAVTALCDVIIFGTQWDSEQALPQLRQALRRLAVTLPRTVAAMEEEGIT